MIEYWASLLRQVVSDRPWLVAEGVLPPSARAAARLRELGASRCFVVASARGTGPAPEPAVAEYAVLGVVADSIMGGIRAGEAALANLPEDVRRRIDAFDPEGRARVIAALFSNGRPVAGRAVYGARPESWQALEDKTLIDAAWDRWGVPRAPCEVVPATRSALEAAAARLDRGAGTVWAGDNREGFNGAAQYTRRVHGPRDAELSADFLAARCDRARVMPFLEGLPCSIHGMVFPGSTISFRPMEMVVLRKAGTPEFHYARSASFWDPDLEDRAGMKAMAERVGEHLRREVGYRGVFTIDGIMTSSGFRPTELNPRYGAALSHAAAALEGLDLYLLHLAVVEGEPLDFREAELERLVVGWMDDNRAGGGGTEIQRSVQVEQAVELVREDDGAWREAWDGEPAHATARMGPGASGGYVGFTFVPEYTPVGRPVAARAASLLTFLDGLWDLDLGELEAASLSP